MIVLINRVCMR